MAAKMGQIGICPQHQLKGSQCLKDKISVGDDLNSQPATHTLMDYLPVNKSKVTAEADVQAPGLCCVFA